ncbi:MAG: disulfide bond formation protein B [Moraxella sp.]|nr:disulfide bond formation protein B [Moraxella sp.]
MKHFLCTLFKSPRQLAFLLFLASVVGTAYALFLQHGMGLEPCPMCIFQRIGLWTMGGFSLLFALINPKKLWAQLLLWTGSLLGIGWAFGVALRHVWLQKFPDPMASCGPGLDFWLQTMPLADILQLILSGSADCGVIDWEFMGLSIPMQSGIFFGLLLVIHGILVRLLFKQRTSA